jgi:uncharacterized protein YndB with AHSA1/START domain
MAASSTSPEAIIRVRRVFAAPREKVFAAWTERQGLEAWMCRDVPTQRAKYLELDARTGGRYLMEVTDSANREVYIGYGTFCEVKPPERLVFTWAWKKRPAAGPEVHLQDESQVTVEFIPQGKSTEVVLTHEYLKEEKAQRETQDGWNGCFDILAKMLQNWAIPWKGASQ